MKNLKILIALILFATASLISMEKENSKKPKQIITRPKRTEEDTKNLGKLGKHSDDVIIKIAWDILNQSDPIKAYKDFVNLSQTNKYINQLLKAASSENDFEAQLRKIKEEIIKFKKDLETIEKIRLEVVKEWEKRGKSGTLLEYSDENIALYQELVNWMKHKAPSFSKDKISTLFEILIQLWDKQSDKKIEMGQILIDNGAPINEKFFNGTTRLFYAIEGSRWDLVDLLLKNGAIIGELENREMISFSTLPKLREIINKYNIQLKKDEDMDLDL